MISWISYNVINLKKKYHNDSNISELRNGLWPRLNEHNFLSYVNIFKNLPKMLMSHNLIINKYFCNTELITIEKLSYITITFLKIIINRILKYILREYILTRTSVV